MKLLIFIITLTFSISSFAQDINKAQMKEMMQKFKEQGMFTEEQIKAAEQKLNAMSDSDIKALKGKAMQQMQENPEIMQKVQDLQNNQ